MKKKKKMGESRNEFLKMFGVTLPDKPLLLPKKSLYRLIK